MLFRGKCAVKCSQKNKTNECSFLVESCSMNNTKGYDESKIGCSSGPRANALIWKYIILRRNQQLQNVNIWINIETTDR